MTIEKFPLALKSELRVVDRNLKREVANLNLQLEANKRVKNGVTFGTNFADSFGMEIDMARTSSDEALTIGQTVITVRDASDFTVGTEVTIFDDVNLERVNIASINGNDITLETALTKDYKEGANIARSMVKVRKYQNTLTFGQWGLREYLEIEVTSTLPYYPRSNDSENSICFFEGFWYLQQNGTIFARYNSQMELVDTKLVEDLGIKHVSSNPGLYTGIFSTEKNLVVYGISDGVTIVKTLDAEFNEVSAISLDGRLDNTVRHDSDSDYIMFSSASSVGYDTQIIKVNRDGSMESYELMDIPAASNNLVNDFIYNDAEGVFMLALQGKIQIRGSDMGLIAEYSHPLASVYPVRINSFGGKYYLYKWHYTKNGTYAGRFTIAESVDGDEWELIFNVSTDVVQESYQTTPPATFMTNDGNIYFTSSNDLLKVNLKKEVLEFEVAKDIPSYSRTRFNFWRKKEGEYVVPFMVSIGGSLMVGEGFLGYGAEINTNDIRFKTKPSKEVVTWLRHDEGLTVTEATFGNINLDLSTLDDETQAVGYTTKEQDEVRLTIERDSIDDDVKAYRILGGTS